MIITFVPPIETAAEIWVPDGLPLDDMHITLFHFESESITYEVGSRIIEAATRYADIAEPFPVTINSLSRFENVRKMQDENGDIVDALVPTDVIIASVDTYGIAAEREKIQEICDELDLPYSKNFSQFKPHLSIKYVPHGENITKEISLPKRFVVDNIQVWPRVGERLVFHFKE